MRPRRASPGRVDTTAPDTQIDTHPLAFAPSNSASFGFSGIGRRAARASPPSSAAATPKNGRPAPRRAATPRSPRAPTASRSGRSTRPATRTRARPPSPGPSTPSRPRPRSTPTRSALVNVATATFTFSGADAGGSGVASFECKLDAGAFAPCSSPRELSGLGDGSHSFEVRAVDNAGNADASPAVLHLERSTPPRRAPRSTPTRRRSSTVAAANFTFSGSDAGGSGVASFECQPRRRPPSRPCTSPRELSGLADGSHTLRSAGGRQGRQRRCRARPPSAGAVDTTAPSTQIDTGPSALINIATADLHLLGRRRRRLRRRLLRMHARRRRLRALLLAARN